MRKNVQIKVYGKVQGVFFRKNTEIKANELYLGGWVKNEPDGSVLIEAEGDEEQVNELVEWCHEGPPFSNVTQVDLNESDLKDYRDFTIIR